MSQPPTPGTAGPVSESASSGGTEGGGQRYRFTRESIVDESAEETFAWHERSGATHRLVPPWEPVHIEEAPPGLEPGTRTVFRTTARGRVVVRWVIENASYDPPRQFRDVQTSGPFGAWDHRHRFAAIDGEGTRVVDEVDYQLPLPLGNAAAWPVVQSRMRRMFDYRHRQLAGDLAAHRRARLRGASPMHVAVTGSSGLIGSALTAFLSSGGHRVTRMVRGSPPEPDSIVWDPEGGRLDAKDLRDVDAVIHLAGAPLFGRWTGRHKRRIHDSRVRGTRLLAETLARMDGGPRVLICGSAVGYYGYQRGDEELTEESTSGGGFLAGVVREWEQAADPAREAGMRVAHVRTGLVQSPRGGVLRFQLPLFQAGLGGRLGPGTQWMSWIGIDDIVGVFHHALTTPELTGAINGTAPEPLTNTEFSRVLGRVLRRPAILPVPRVGPSLLLGEQGATETALASQRVLPAHAEETGYVFRHSTLAETLRHVLGR